MRLLGRILALAVVFLALAIAPAAASEGVGTDDRKALATMGLLALVGLLATVAFERHWRKRTAAKAAGRRR